MMRRQKFNEWSEANDWAKETERELVNIGTVMGGEIVQQWEHGSARVELWREWCEYVAEGVDKYSDILCLIRCFDIVVRQKENEEPVLEHHDNMNEALDSFEEWKQLLQ